MRIQRLLDYLRYSELANLKFNDLETDPVIKTKVFNFIDRALAAVNVEFNINQVEVLLPLKLYRARYFINDAKLIKLIAAYTSEGIELPLNNENIHNSVFTPSLNIIDYRGDNLSTEDFEDYLSLIYLKGFNDVKGPDDLVNISEGLLECVTNYVGYIAYSSVDMSGDSPAKYYFTRYKDAVATAKANGFNNDDNTDFSRLKSRGFV
jgi:hypothetical protein